MARWARLGSAVLTGILVGLLLLLLMQSLVSVSPPSPVGDRAARIVDFLPSTAEEPGKPERPEPPEPARTETPPIPPQPLPQPAPLLESPAPDAPALQMEPPPLAAPSVPTYDVPDTPASAPAPAAKGTQQATDRDVVPVARVQPLYPRSARRRGIEGSVLVEFTVTREGTTRDVRVIESSPPGVFDQAAVSAARQFRFHPRIQNGEPVPATGVRNRITFRLEN